MTPVTPNQSYLVKNMQFRMAAAVVVLLDDLGYDVPRRPGAYRHQPGDAIFYPTGWRKDKQTFTARPHGSWKTPRIRLAFASARWDSTASDLKYGPETIDHKAIENDAGKTKIIRNGTDGQIHVSYEESTELTNSFSSSITKGVTLDLTEDAEVASEQKVSGSYAGVSAEVGLSEKFGISKSKSKSTEVGKEQAEEGTKNESLAIEFDAAAHSNYLVEITKREREDKAAVRHRRGHGLRPPHHGGGGGGPENGSQQASPEGVCLAGRG